MKESKQIIIAVVIIAVGWILTTLATGWWTRQICKRIIKELKAQGAVNAANAVSLPYSPEAIVKSSIINFGYRDYRPKALEILILGEVVTKTVDDKYYLNEDMLL
jgi:hypothetical protein